MKKLLASLILLATSVSYAGHLDVLEVTLKEGCSFSDFLAIVQDFNEYAEGYQVEIAAPLFHDDLDTVYWLGRSANNAAFGTAYDDWMSGVREEGSVADGLGERLAACVEFPSRRAYNIYP